MNKNELRNISVSLSLAVETIISSELNIDAFKVANTCMSAIKQILNDNPLLENEVKDLIEYTYPELIKNYEEWINS